MSEIIQVASVEIVPQDGKIQQAKSHYQIIVDFIKSVMREGVDYGTAPGVSKPSLLKPGAEKLAQLFNLRPEFQILESVSDWSGKEHGLEEPVFFYRYKCVLFYPRFPKDGEQSKPVGEGIGSCNSLEKKYRYRRQSRVCPKCGQETIFTSNDGSFYCWAKKGGCNAKYAANDEAIIDQPTGLIKNPDIYEQVNTIDKMSQKRALIAAILVTCGVSEFFSQDIENISSNNDDSTNTNTAKNSTAEREILREKIGVLVGKLNWTVQQAKAFVKENYGVWGRDEMSDSQLKDCVKKLEERLRKM
ncbi:hypothetical protein F7734_53465 [Scytonema sp. UIC 10036]|uniref:hypothetical protein n=1 Tax=Scytonema sp. UIC 10036 TaxID=2304196 RepID=UPI0012DAC76C|nr:hypothetical protein [Scytonema sp. UIC 10036]MUH00618.1 hypothetical protein [Scytonema sp. UIC 10036]